MRSYIVLGAAALVAASPAPAPAPQAFDINKVEAIPVTITRGPPSGAGPATVTGVYNQDDALATAAAAASGAATAAAVNKRSLEERSWCFFGVCFGATKVKSTSTTTVQATTTAKATTTAPPVITSSPVNVVPSTCTPVSWTNTFAFTSDPACPTPYEVGTYCGFINPEDPCAPQPGAYGPPTTPDTVDAFQKNPTYHQMAQSAKIPSGYTQTFKDLNASVNANGYLGYKVLQSYDVAGCASFCEDTDLCTGFNVWIERDPAWEPAKCSCQNPTSIANYKCSIWGSGVDSTAATNVGQGRDNFTVVIVGSNGYNKTTTPVTPPGYTNPQNCGKKLHNQPSYCLGQQSFPGPFDVSLCAAYAASQNEQNQKAGFLSALLSTFFGYNPAKCVQFQAAYLEKDGAGWGTHCRLFAKKFDKGLASYDISSVGTSKWGCQKSFTYDLA